VFAVSSLGTETVLCSFTGGADGGYPSTGLIFDANGNLYGATAFGGASNAGVVFRMDPKGNETVLYSFKADGKDGNDVQPGLVFDQAGNLYGTTLWGGGKLNGGIVFSLSPQQNNSWTETVLYTFTGKHGAHPTGGVVLDSLGNLYGTANGGGLYDSGVAFKLAPKVGGGWTQKVIHNFENGKDGANPDGSLIFDAQGNLYGVTRAGGTGRCDGGNTCGIAFELVPTASGGWKRVTLHSFSKSSGGTSPAGGLILNNGALYGVTSLLGRGTAFRITF
jgi:uncharacterized repeat protein (TIGR03803 family)